MAMHFSSDPKKLYTLHLPNRGFEWHFCHFVSILSHRLTIRDGKTANDCSQLRKWLRVNRSQFECSMVNSITMHTVCKLSTFVRVAICAVTTKQLGIKAISLALWLRDFHITSFVFADDAISRLKHTEILVVVYKRKNNHYTQVNHVSLVCIVSNRTMNIIERDTISCVPITFLTLCA